MSRTPIEMWLNMGFLRCGLRNAAGEEFDVAAPLHHTVGAVIDIGGPMEARRRDVAEAPAALRCLVDGELLDIGAGGAAEHARIELLHRIEPEDVPGVERRIIDAEGRAIEVRRGADRIVARTPRRRDPHILD